MASARAREPRLDLVATVFRVRGASGRPLRAAVYRVETGLALRIEDEDRNDDVQRSQLFRVGDDEAIARLGDEWHQAFITTGFEDLPVTSF